MIFDGFEISRRKIYAEWGKRVGAASSTEALVITPCCNFVVGVCVLRTSYVLFWVTP